MANPNSDVTGSTVAANHNKVKGSGHFGTRELMPIIVYTAADTITNYRDPNSLYAQLVRAIQLNAEVYAVGIPALNSPTQDPFDQHAFAMIIAWDTAVSLETSLSYEYNGDVNEIQFPFITNDLASNMNNMTKILSEVVYDCLEYNQVNTSSIVVWAPLVGDFILPAMPAAPKP